MPDQPAPIVVDAPGAFTASWVEAAMRAGGRDTRVDAVTSVTPVGTGQMASCYRIALRGDTRAPASIVAKVAAPNANAMAAGGYRNEIRFYEVIAPIASGRLADCYYAAMVDDGARFVLLLEDLAPAVQGDQIAGCDAAVVRTALEHLGALHGSLWQHPVLDTFAPPLDDALGGDDSFASFMGWGTDEFVARYADRLCAADVDVLRTFAARTLGFRNNRPAPPTIRHGDYRLDNLLYRDDPVECIVVDWQTAGVGPAGHDLAYCISTALEPEARRAADRDLVAAYGDRLRAHGVSREDAELWDDYRFGLGHGITVTVLGAVVASRTERGDDMFMAMASRVCAAVRDHDALAMYR
jgi:aminoglycoside/choline kinase family phosphotransferase